MARNDRLITLSWNVTVTKAGTDGTWLAGTKMSASLAGLSVSDYDVSGVTLVDPVNSKRYLVARSGGSREGQGRCVCSTVSSALQAGNAMSLGACARTVNHWALSADDIVPGRHQTPRVTRPPGPCRTVLPTLPTSEIGKGLACVAVQWSWNGLASRW